MLYQDIINSLPFRIFSVQIDDDLDYWIGLAKTDDDFQADIRAFTSEWKNMPEESILKSLDKFMEDQGYIKINQLVSDSYAGKMLSTRSRIIPDD